MSAEPRYYYVDAQNQAAGPIAMAGLLALKSAGTVTDATLIVAEGGTEWVAFSTLKPAGPTSTPSTAAGASPSSTGSSPAAQAAKAPSPASSLSPSSFSATTEPAWAGQLSQKVDRLIGTMEKLIVSLEKSRPQTMGAPVPATAALHAEKINLNPLPKPGIASFHPTGMAAANPPAVRPAPVPLTSPAAAPAPVAPPRSPGAPSPTPLAVPANAQKSPLPLPTLGKPPGPAPAGIPKPSPATPAPAKGNIFSKFLKK